MSPTLPRSAVLLREWREAQKLSQAAAARQLGVDQARFCQFEGGKRRPGLALAVRIDRGTNGAVPVDGWHEEVATSEEKEVTEAAG